MEKDKKTKLNRSNLSPTVNNFLAVFDCKTAANAESLELQSAENSEGRFQKSSTKEAYIQILCEMDDI